MRIYNYIEIARMLRHCKDVTQVVDLAYDLDTYIKLGDNDLSRSVINNMAHIRIDNLLKEQA